MITPKAIRRFTKPPHRPLSHGGGDQVARARTAGRAFRDRPHGGRGRARTKVPRTSRRRRGAPASAPPFPPSPFRAGRAHTLGTVADRSLGFPSRSTGNRCRRRDALRRATPRTPRSSSRRGDEPSSERRFRPSRGHERRSRKPGSARGRVWAFPLGRRDKLSRWTSCPDPRRHQRYHFPGAPRRLAGRGGAGGCGPCEEPSPDDTSRHRSCYASASVIETTAR
jgi:hypothetical protein